MKFCTIFILTLLILSCYGQSCANAANPEDRIQSGSLQITTNYSPQTAKGTASQRENAFTVVFRIPVSSGYQIVAAFSQYSLTSVASNNQDFSISAVPLTDNSAKLIVLINDDGSWARIKVSYLVTARIDFFLGTFVGDGYFKPKNSNGELVFSYTIPLWNPQSSQATAIGLLSGLRVITTELPLLKISNAKINTTNGKVEVAVAFNSKNTFEYIQISYICFLATSSLKFNRFDPSIASSSTYQLVFVDSFVNKQAGFNGVGFDGSGLLNCNGANCAKACISNDKCKSGSGVISGTNCFLCSNGQKYVNGNCYSTGGIKCEANQAFDGFECACIEGYYKTKDVCYPSCGIQAYVDAKGTCQCTEGSQEQSNKTSVQDLSKLVQQSIKICVKYGICQINEVNVEGVCQCAQGYALINGKCSIPFLCPNNTIWQPASFSCVCANGFFLINDICGTCLSNSVWNGTACNCNQGYQKINGVCKTCQANAAWNGTNCACLSGFYLSGNDCVACPAGTFRQGPICQACPSFCQVCSSISTCTQCQVGYLPNQSGTCVSSTPTSKMQLAGSVDNNRLILQGIAINEMPATVKQNNCDICSNLFSVSVTTPGVTVSKSLDYIVDSQYWFVVTFDYETTQPRAFNFTIKIDPTYKNVFTVADMNQVLLGSIDPTVFPSFADVVSVKPTVGTNQISRSTSPSGSGQTKPNIQVLTPIKTNTTNPISPVTKGRLSTGSAQVKAIFG